MLDFSMHRAALTISTLILKLIIVAVVTTAPDNGLAMGLLSPQVPGRINSDGRATFKSSPNRVGRSVPGEKGLLMMLGMDSAGGNTETITLKATRDPYHRKAFKFHLPSQLRDLDVNKAKLYFNIRPRSKNSALKCKKYQKQNLDITIIDALHRSNMTLTKRVPRHRPRHGWYSVRNSTRPLTELVILYKKHKRDAIDVVIECPNCCSNPLSDDALPILVVQASKPVTYVNDATATAPNCFGKCCVKHLVVDFDELGYDWVIYPRRYVANYCEGSCRRSDLLPSDISQLSTNTLILQAMLQQRRIDSAGSSCVPKDTTPVRIVYRDSTGAIRTSTLHTVESCQCS